MEKYTNKSAVQNKIQKNICSKSFGENKSFTLIQAKIKSRVDFFFKATSLKKSTANRVNGKKLDTYPLKSKLRMSTLQVQQHMKSIIYHEQVGLICGMQGWFKM